jgi:outer membrane protein assembly factor BamB
VPEHFRIHLIFTLVAGVVLLPAAILLLRLGRRNKIKRLLSVVFSTLLGVVLAAWGTLFLLRYGGLEMEWRGGYIPALTWSKTHTDIAAVERSRTEQKTNSPAPAQAHAARAESASYWTGFRGPRRDGIYDERPILTNWPATGLRLLWRQPCGGGYSSFAIADGRAFTLEQRRDSEVVAAYDVATGRELWTNGWDARFSEYHSDEGPRGTPTYDDGVVYAIGATGEMRALNATNGAVIWSKNIAKENGNSLPDYGLASSPLVVGNRIIVQPDISIVCYDKRDGKRLWQAADSQMGYASPILMTLGGEQQVVVCGRPYTYGLRVEDGAERWKFLWHIIDNERPITQPAVLGTNRLFLSAAYLTGCAAFEIDRTNDAFEAHQLWRSRSIKTKFASVVVWQGYIYGFDEDILDCVDAQTGQRMWKDGRYGYGQVLLASGHLVVQCADGELALVKATPDAWTEEAKFQALNGKSWNVPAISGGRLLMRNGAEMACYDISAPDTDVSPRLTLRSGNTEVDRQ